MLRPQKVLILVAALICALAGVAVAASERYALPGDNVFPEGISAGTSGSEFYVGSTTTGTIFRGDTDSGDVAIALPGGADDRNDVRGIEVTGRRLYAAGGPTGRIYVYDLESEQLLARFETGLDPTFVNDVAVAPNGDAYFTDSNSPAIYRVAADIETEDAFSRWSDLSGSPIEYAEGFNLNGIVATDDGRYLIVVQSNAGKLFRVEIASKEITEVNLGGADLTGGDGLLLDGQTLHVMRNAAGELVTLELSDDFARATHTRRTTDPEFDFPTTIAQVGDRLLVVNSQLNKRQSGDTPDLPFEVLAIPAPGGQPDMPNSGGGGLVDSAWGHPSTVLWTVAFGLLVLGTVTLRLRRSRRG